jgi:hypothetical protein
MLGLVWNFNMLEGFIYHIPLIVIKDYDNSKFINDATTTSNKPKNSTNTTFELY